VARPNRSLITEALEQWARAKAKAIRVEAKRDSDLAPIKQKFERQCAPIENDAKEKLAPLEKQMREFGRTIEKELRLGINGDGTIVMPQVMSESAVAKVNAKDGDRVIDPSQFFEAVAPAKRDSMFWSCVKVHVQKAEKAYGDIVNRISQRLPKHVVEIKLKD
jgi:hypothetical protein